MKRIVSIIVIMVFLLGEMAVFVYASPPETIGFYNIGTAENVTITGEGTDRLYITLENAVSGAEYLVMLVRGSSLPQAEENNKYYDIRQTTATNTTVDFDLNPRLITNSMDMTLFITNSANDTVIAIPLSYWAGQAAYLIGDADDNGVVDARDRMLFSRYLAKWDGYDASVINMGAMDINGDGSVTTKDRVILSRYLAKWGREFSSYFDQ